MTCSGLGGLSVRQMVHVIGYITSCPGTGGIDPGNSSQFSCANIPPHGYNEARYCNPGMVRLQSLALTSYDRCVRASTYRRIEALLARNTSFVAFWWQRQQEALAVDMKGFGPNPRFRIVELLAVAPVMTNACCL